MNLSYAQLPYSGVAADLLAVPLFEEGMDEKAPSSAVAELNQALGGVLLKAAAEEGFKAKADQSFTLHTHGKLQAPRVLLLGLGARAKFNHEALRMAAGRAAKAAQRTKAARLALALPVPDDLDGGARAAVEGLGLGAYRFDRYRTVGKEERAERRSHPASVELILPAGARKDRRRLDAAIALGTKVAQSTNWARDLVNEPGGVMTPSRLAEEAKKAAAAAGLEIEVVGRKEIQALKMGMFLGVAQGSVEEPRLVHLWYTPKNPRAAKRRPIALVGKAITFDSGGLSIKTADGMIDMKTDMAGSAAVMAAMQVVPLLNPPFPVHAFLGACENMPSGNAYRPGDVLISRLGKTVEITNTDAEGRLVLGDVLAWAAELNPSALIDAATLTGACMIALGHYITGAFGNDPALMQSLLQAGQAAGEELWWMPVTDLQKEALKSDVADMKNSGERWGGAINAAMFLKEFVRDLPWVHLDIAGPSLSQKDRGYYNKGATGCAARTLVEFIRRQARTGGGGGGAARTKAPAAARAAPGPRRKMISSPSRPTPKAPRPKGTARRPAAGRRPARATRP